MPFESTYSQTWKQASGSPDIWEHYHKLDAHRDVKMSATKIFLELCFTFIILISSAYTLSWFDHKVAYNNKPDSSDVPTYFEHGDQYLLSETFIQGYIGRSSHRIGYLSSSGP